MGPKGAAKHGKVVGGITKNAGKNKAARSDAG